MFSVSGHTRLCIKSMKKEKKFCTQKVRDDNAVDCQFSQSIDDTRTIETGLSRCLRAVVDL